jgi:GTP-binding protein
VILGVQENRGRRIATTQLNRMLRDILAFDTLPTDRKGRALKLFYCTQAGVNPPSFVFFVNSSDLATKAFANHIEKEIRGLGDFSGTPIRIFWRNRTSD